MTVTINYDQAVKDLIDELNRTSHVTHVAYRKTSVTLHHNAGRLSHEGVLNVWRTRPASAHFDVDRYGRIAQYVKVNEYAWAAGNREGNMRSIHIEMANSSLAPTWAVADVTWKAAARLAGWLFARVIGARPTRDNFFYHSHWTATACAGPFMDRLYVQVLEEVQRNYDRFKRPAPVTSTPPKKTIAQIASEVIDGKWGNGVDRKERLKKAGYDFQTVQNEVNRLLKGNPRPKPRRKSNTTIAKEVIDGKWGNGDDRRTRLEKAGYDYEKVQQIVNRLV